MDAKITVGSKILDLETKQYGYVTKVTNHNFSVDFCLPYPDQGARILFTESTQGTEWDLVEQKN
jgi:hypothetical protein